ncbi:cellulase family protein [Paecilomyces variotii No. 5]|uniref:Cellulase family protein n=1 Tax=Byssochlamys spectabilis (strain No. 5 / NBRC 109023) TaxID=1356009 RepID=V5HZE5_BYSSN|nr:cellulase family protein [Paecilomyces variotii No. 5]
MPSLLMPTVYFLCLLTQLIRPTIGQLHTSSRWILDSANNRVKLRCVNWAGHMEVNIPEGLQYQSVDTISSFIADNGFNCVRLTYSIDMALGPNTSVSDSFNNAAGATGVPVSNMTALYQQALSKNSFLGSSTILDVFGAVIDSLESKGVYTILDNHVSKASWCCNLTDGNGWWDTALGYNKWNSQYFHTDDWIKGLEFMAHFAAGHSGVVGMSLRNELRPIPLLQDTNGHKDWYNLISQAATTVHTANPDVLIIIGGSQSATDLSFVSSNPLNTTAWADKHVWEFHAYSFTVTFPNPTRSCSIAKAEYGALNGFVLEQDKPYTGPLILSEFGVGMTGGPDQGLSDDDSKYLGCLVEYMESNDAEWAVWAIQGSYYVRSSTVDYDEDFGLLNHDWSGWRNSNFSAMLGNMWQVTQGP